MAALERFGLAATKFEAPNRVVIETSWGAAERASVSALRAWIDWEKRDRVEDTESEIQRTRLLRRMRSYVYAAHKWFIGYDNDLEIVSSYRERAEAYGANFFEREAFPPDVRIADRTFGEWTDACNRALGRILSHIDFAAMLQKKSPKKVALHNVLTIFARREDVAEVWVQSGLSPDRLESTMAALTLEAGDLDDWEDSYETPTPFYVDLGRDFVLLPCFGALGNPYFALFKHLRSTYKADWDRGVDRREDVFRADLARLFPHPRFVVPAHGFQLKRLNGSMLTDIDAAILDARTGRLAIVQLKWHDIFGRSLAERESRLRNISGANVWIEKVSSWIGGRSSREVADALGLRSAASDASPVLFIVARYIASFSGQNSQDARATWISWPELIAAMAECVEEDPLVDLKATTAAHRSRFDKSEAIHKHFHFPSLTVELHVAPS